MDEKSYIEGSKSAWKSILVETLKNLDSEDKQLAGLVWEREAAITTLRNLCEELGDNDWPDNLFLSDIIEKHLGRYLYKR